jgi:hypothetical protein
MNKYIKGGPYEKEKQREKEIKDRKVTEQKLDCMRRINAIYKQSIERERVSVDE